MLRSILSITIIIVLLSSCSSSLSPVKPPKSLTKIDNAFKINKIWSFKINEGASDKYLKLSPVLDGDILYNVDHRGMITAIRITDRNVLWETNIGREIGSPLTLSGNKLYLGTSDGQVIALNKEDGQQLWSVDVSSEVLSAPAVGKGYVIVRCVNGELFALKSQNGEKVWKDRQIIPSLTLRGTSAPVIYNDVVLSAFDNGKLLAYNLQTGRILWERSIAEARGRSTLERLVDIDAELVVSDDIIYAVAFQGKVAAIAVASGQVIWSRDFDSYIGMAVDPYRIYIVDSNSEMLALDKSNGATHWKQDALLRRSVTRPLLHSNYVLLGDLNGFIHWFRRDTGQLVARVKIDSFDSTNPSLDEEEDLKYPKSRDILTAPVTKENVVIALDRHGNAEAFEISYP